ncbi:MAG: sulfatase-like hydrolase/transferase [Solirubrobacterales bacterium]|nr:sulfatase-like hydrolase/transferase [Solirubrobacterales bacterium]
MQPSPDGPALKVRRFLSSRESLRVWLELAGCWSLAVAWPIFQRLDAGPEILTVNEVRGLDLLLFTVLVTFVAPTVIFGIETLVSRIFSSHFARVIHAGVLGVLLGLVFWQVIQAHPTLAVLALIAVAVGFAALYLKLEFMRSFALLLGIATPVVLALFLTSYPIRAEVLPGKKALAPQSTESKTPVVMIVLDELPLPLLLDRDGNLDEKLIPELKPLKRETTWYPDMLTVGDQTLTALPVIMTGEDPTSGETRPPPGLSGYPDNLCSITAKAGYRVRAQEELTDLCPRISGRLDRLSALLRMGTVATRKNGSSNPDRITPGGKVESTIKKFTDRHPAPPSVFGFYRANYARNFAASLDTSKRSFDFLHIVLPHAPFQYTETGQGYPSLVFGDTGTQKALEDPESEAESDKHMQQNISQTAFALRLVGEVIKRMKALGTWDESLFVVTADHGASFKVGSSRRTIREPNSGWLLPVPLFIKYPGQSHGKVDRRPVSSRDIAPTVLDTLGLKPSPRATGQSLLGDPADKKALEMLDVTSTDEVDLDLDVKRVEARKQAAVAMKARAFGSGTLYAPGGRADLLGKSVKGKGRWEPLDVDFLTDGPQLEVDPDGPFIPIYTQVNLPGVKSNPGTIAIAVNGKVAGTTRAWERDGVWMTGMNLPIGAFRKGENTIGYYLPG